MRGYDNWKLATPEDTDNSYVESAILRWEEDEDYYLERNVEVRRDAEGYLIEVIDEEDGTDLTKLSRMDCSELIDV